jgi:hypothetical protein
MSEDHSDDNLFLGESPPMGNEAWRPSVKRNSDGNFYFIYNKWRYSFRTRLSAIDALYKLPKLPSFKEYLDMFCVETNFRDEQ